MKKIRLFLMVMWLVILTTSCNKYVYHGQKIGILELKNNSESTLQEVWVNKTTYGILSPGKSMKIKLAPGVYTWQLKGVGGIDGCTEVTGSIIAGYTQSFNCSVK